MFLSDRHPLSHPLMLVLFVMAGIALSVGQVVMVSGVLQPILTGEVVVGLFRQMSGEAFPLEWLVIDSFAFHGILWVLLFSLWHFIHHLWRHRFTRVRLISLLAAGGIAVAMISVVGGWAVSSSLVPDGNFENFVLATMPFRAMSAKIMTLVAILAYSLYLVQLDRDDRVQSERRLRDSLRESELNLLKSRIHPHFLFNSLNSASMLALSEPEKASDMIVALSEFLRRSLSAGQETLTTVQEEISHAKRYLGIETIRFGDRLRTSFTLTDDCRELTLPTLLLQPLYENAVKYGVYESLGKVEISTLVYQVDGALHIEIRNTCDGDSSPRKGTGFGLRSIRERLQLVYGTPDAWLQTERLPTGYVARLSVPILDGRPTADASLA